MEFELKAIQQSAIRYWLISGAKKEVEWKARHTEVKYLPDKTRNE